MEKVEYLSKQLVFYIHLVAIDEEFCEYDGHSKYSNEMRGIKDYALFDSAICEPMKSFAGQDLYPDIITKAACYLRSLAMNHSFFDGNKRTALLSTIIFLELNGYKVTCDNSTLYNLTKEIVENKDDVLTIAKKLKQYTRISKMSKLKELFRNLGLLYKREN